MATELIKERLGEHFYHCQRCREIFITLTDEAEKGLFSIYKKKCYERLSAILNQECSILLNRRVGELSEELTALSAHVGEAQGLKCNQIVSHYFSLKFDN